MVRKYFLAFLIAALKINLVVSGWDDISGGEENEIEEKLRQALLHNYLEVYPGGKY